MAPENLKEPYAEWTPVQESQLADLHAYASTVSSYDIQVEDVANGKKRKRYASSDEPMSLWLPTAPFFLDALVRWDGLGDYSTSPACVFCQSGHDLERGQRIFRCPQCGPYLQCNVCMREKHTLNPLHTPKEWNGEFWTEVGPDVAPVYQIGHHGLACPFPEPPQTLAPRKMVVVDIHGIFELRVQYCSCAQLGRRSNLTQLLGNGWYPATITDPGTCATFAVLDYFRLLNVVGNLNVHDFMGMLERLTDPTFTNSTPDRYRPFRRMSRQYNFLKRAKRAGRAHVNDGLLTTDPGALAVACWACPDPGRNLPSGWEDVDAQYLYKLLLAMDANFRLKNRLRKNEHQDPSLGSGLGYFVELTNYKDYLRDCITEDDVSTCVAFAALTQKETQNVTGLRVSGVGGCVCARHGLVRALGLGDLQKGERYSNMDYILLSSLMGVKVKELAISYDIACQWSKNLPKRAVDVAGLPSISTDLSAFSIQYAVPVWHAGAHELECQVENSLTYADGVGRTDGESIERMWATLNPIAYSTKEMGEGARHDSIEDRVDHINYEKNVGFGRTLLRKLIVAIDERTNQAAEVEDLESTVDIEFRQKWRQQIDEWRLDSSNPNPYLVRSKAGPSEAEVLADLKQAELEEMREGRAPVVEGETISTAEFVKIALRLEATQLRIKADANDANITADRSSQIHELRMSFSKKLAAFERLQNVFMPGVAELRSQLEESRDPDIPPPQVEDIRLFLPSDLTKEQRQRMCRRAIVEAEVKLRLAQCGDTIANLRTRLHAQMHLVYWRNSHVTGQKASTRSNTLIGRVGERIARLANKYRHTRAALHRLKGPNFSPEFKELRAEDLSARAPRESDAMAMKELNKVGAERRARNEPALASATMRLSWIWSVGGGVSREEIHDSIRVEWCKARARRDRWYEEVALLREEMKRVLRSLRAAQTEWEGCVGQRTGCDTGLAGGLDAYARRQAAIHKRLAERFHDAWNVSIATAVRSVIGDILVEDGPVHRALLDSESGLDVAGAGVEIPVETDSESTATRTRRYPTRASQAGAMS
ncbi:hypothetical protein GGX14DRAFT_364154 [Mycena pura]|uniref:CxC2-like cysteine cluster KDZ transposase-associated domain-containing protein n=1 Tax=Mycena pura TaxID=153505 RepID=A0AAD6VCX7_9AGAR|nr:hypothetical protein GGX14DRAFT_364154 [Mycena pura]